MKKIISIVVASIMMLIFATGCTNTTGMGNAKDTNAGTQGSAQGASKDGMLSIVTTIFPEYDWVREIVAGNYDVQITMLLDKGVDLHSFQPTADDIVKVSCCDVFVYVGGESDEWVEDVLAEAINKDMVVINLLDVLGDSVKEEELVEGMEGEEEEGEGEEEEEPEYDEHVWLSLKNAEVICRYIADELKKVDSAKADLYEKNVTAYIEKLDALDKEYEAAANAASVKTVLFGDRFPFRYMVDDYGLDYFAAFVGCSAESEASFETISFLAGKVDELGLGTIMKIEGSDGKIAETIISCTSEKNQQILSMNSMQAITAKDVEAGTTYLGIMESNLEVLKQALK